MLRVKQLLVVLAVAAGTLLAAAGPVAARQGGTSGSALLKVAHQSTFGQILVTPQNKALYHFSPEKDGKIHCTGSCATVWPPLLVPAGAAVPARLAGASGKFGVVSRPDHTRQVTYQGYPLYTYVNDVKPLQVLCNNVGGWFVVKVSSH
jgi:predicted lipoprotein with Yx(FWY)xxD motif